MNKTTYNSRLIFLLFTFYFFLLTSCSIERKIEKSARANVLNTPALKAAHVGISIYEPATNSYWYNFQADKYFVPASNTKIPTCYAAMKYLGDSLVGLRYDFFDDTTITVYPTGDPSFLHPDFKSHPILNFLSQKKYSFYLYNGMWKDERLGSGWSWNDYNSYYMTERSAFPVYGNVVKLRPVNINYQLHENGRRSVAINWQIVPSYFKGFISNQYILPLKMAAWREMRDSSIEKEYLRKYAVERYVAGNTFTLVPGVSVFTEDEIPFFTNNDSTTVAILRNDLSINIQRGARIKNDDPPGTLFVIRSQPTDSLLKPMMHRSDNFFAEQALLMVSNERLGVMNDEKIIDTLLKTDFKDLPQKPRWADGSGLSRYNLFTPQDFVTILSKMKNEFGMERLKVILATGGEGTISNYYKADSGYIYGKTGTLSGVVAFSGFLYTKKGKLLIFSTLINNHNGSATEVRKAIEKFLQQLRADY